MEKGHNKEMWWQYNEFSRGENYDQIKRSYHIWKFFGRYIYKCLIGPFNAPRSFWLRLFGAQIGKNNNISSRAIIVYPGTLRIGNGNAIDDYAYFNDVTIIGNNCQISSFVKFVGGGHNVRSRAFDYLSRPIVLGDSVFIGANSVILGGVK